MKFPRLLITFGLLLASATLSSAETKEQRRKTLEERGQKVASAEATERKARTMARLKAEGVFAPEHLPVIEDTKGAKVRSAEEIAERAIAICLTAIKGEGTDQALVDSLVKKYEAAKFFTPEEAAFIKNPSPSQQDRVQFSWRYECYWVLLWALGYVETMDRPEGICDVPKAVGFRRDLGTAQFIKGTKLRPIGALLDETDPIYRYHWAVVDARIKSKPAPAKLEKGVVQERHYVLNWIIGYMNQDWDHISTDT